MDISFVIRKVLIIFEEKLFNIILRWKWDGILFILIICQKLS